MVANGTSSLISRRHLMKITNNRSLVRAEFVNSLIDQMKLCGYRPHTIKAYLGQVHSFLRFSRQMGVNTITEKGIRNYLNHLVDRSLSRSTIDQAAKAMEIFYYEALCKRLDLLGFKRPKKDRPSPVLLTFNEVNQIASKTKDNRHRLMIELAYSAGLRVSELVEIRVKSLDFERLTLLVPGIGRSDRTTLFSKHLRTNLINQVGTKSGDQYLFPSKRGGKLTTRAVAKFFKKALVASGLKKMVTPHSLRQSFTTTMLDKGADPNVLQNILGRRSLTNLTQDSKKAA